MILWLDLLRFIPLLLVIAYAGYLDFRTGEVPNKLWLYLPFGLCLTLIELCFEPWLILPSLLSFGFTSGLAFFLFYINGWGGADTKAFLTIAACLPLLPFHETFSAFSIYPLEIIIVSSVLAIILAKVRRKSAVRFLPYVAVGMILSLCF